MASPFTFTPGIAGEAYTAAKPFAPKCDKSPFGQWLDFCQRL